MKKDNAFTMLQVMMALVVVSIMLAVMAPVITAAKPSEAANIQVNQQPQIIDTTPVGVIVAWYGSNYPEGWIPVSGQTIDPAQYPLLRNALGRDVLPDLNAGIDPENAATWIIKAQKQD